MAVVEAIATTYLEADTSSVTFSSLGSYEHLQLRMSVMTDRGWDNQDPVKMIFNSDTGTNYSFYVMRVLDSTSASTSQSGVIAFWLWDNGVVNAGDEPSNYGGIEVDIFDYRNTNKNTTICGIGSPRRLVSGSEVAWGGGVWEDTSAVTSINLTPQYATNFMRGSEFSLYGWNSA